MSKQSPHSLYTPLTHSASVRHVLTSQENTFPSTRVWLSAQTSCPASSRLESGFSTQWTRNAQVRRAPTWRTARPGPAVSLPPAPPSLRLWETQSFLAAAGETSPKTRVC